MRSLCFVLFGLRRFGSGVVVVCVCMCVCESDTVIMTSLLSKTRCLLKGTFEDSRHCQWCRSVSGMSAAVNEMTSCHLE